MRIILCGLGLVWAIALTGCGNEGDDYEPQAEGTFEQDVLEGGPEEPATPPPDSTRQALPEYEENTPGELADGDE